MSVETKNPHNMTFCINLNLDQINSSGDGIFAGMKKSELSGKLPILPKGAKRC